MTLVTYIIIAHCALFTLNQFSHFRSHLVELSARQDAFEDAELNGLAKSLQQLE
jgi:hypothetical protein